jgi:hypothetical protein
LRLTDLLALFHLEPPISDAIADGWSKLVETVLPTIGGTKHTEANIAFHFGAIYVLQIAQQMIAHRSGEELALVNMLDSELDDFMKSHSIAIQ